MFYYKLFPRGYRSPGHKRGVCGHLMARFDLHAHCARCRDMLKGTSEQKLQLSTPSFQKKKEIGEQKSVMADKSTRSDKYEDVSDTLVVCSPLSGLCYWFSNH